MAKRVVLAYSGGLDTSVAVRWMIESLGVEVVCLSADVDQEGRRDLRAGALAMTARVRGHTLSLPADPEAIAEAAAPVGIERLRDLTDHPSDPLGPKRGPRSSRQPPG